MDYLSIKDFMRLFGLSYQMAARLMRKVKAHGDRLGLAGKIHIADYNKYFGKVG